MMITACKHVPASHSLDQPTDTLYDVPYYIDVNDVLAVTAFGEDDFSGQYIVDSDGILVLPLIGPVHVKGQTTNDIETALTNKLADGYLVNPIVSVTVIRSRPVYIMGEVRSPGEYEFAQGMSILNAVALAGGFTYRANRKQFDIFKPDDQTPRTGTLHTIIKPGDVIVVDERLF